MWVIITGFKLVRNKENHFLLALFVNIAFVSFMTFNRYYENFDIYSTWFPFQAFAVLTSFPLFFLYILSVASTKKLSIKTICFHFILPLIMGISMFLLMFGFMNKHERFLFISEHVYSQSINILKFNIGYILYRGGKIIYILQSVFYLILTIKLYRNHVKKTSDIFSNDEGVDLSWLKYIGIAFVIVFIFNLIMHGLKLNYISTHNLLVIVSYIIFNSFFMLLGILSIKQKPIFDNFAYKYESIIDDNLAKELSIVAINNYLKDEKPYLNPKYSIYDMCSKFNINRTYISNIINKDYGNNFKTLINSFRINDAKKIIKEYKSRNELFVLKEIASDVGFNSYATFLRVFKQHIGVSPKEYVDNI